MRLFQSSSPFLSLAAILLLSQQATAALIPEFFQKLDFLQSLEKRCENSCGYYGQLCCAANQRCYTDANGQAACAAAQNVAVSSGGSWQYMTTTYIQTDLKTVTATYSTYVPGITQAPTTSQCQYSLGQTQCGTSCCQAGQYCQSNNVCVAVPGGSSGYYSNVYTTTVVITNTAGVPLRPTTNTILTLTSSVTGTTAFQTPVSTSGAVIGASASGGGLSGGAIAGIVLGVIFGLLLLFIICACCCFKGLIDAVLGFFGGRRRRVVEETTIEERRHTGGRTWFGTRPARSEVVEEKKSSNFARAAGLTAFLGTTAVLLGLKRRSDRKDDAASVSYDSYYSYDYTSDSSPSSITRTSRRSRSRR